MSVVFSVVFSVVTSVETAVLTAVLTDVPTENPQLHLLSADLQIEAFLPDRAHQIEFCSQRQSQALDAPLGD